MRNPWSVPRLMFPSRGSASTRAAFAPLGPGAEPVPHLHRSYAALRLPCRFSTPPVCPRSCLTRWASALFCARWCHHHEAGRRSACCRRRVGEGHRFSVARILLRDGQGSPRLPGRPLRPCRSRPPRPSPADSPYRRRKCCFQGSRHLEHSGFAHFGAAFLRPTRSPDYASTVPSRETAASLATSLLARL
jgi:hypothetical protein